MQNKFEISNFGVMRAPVLPLHVLDDLSAVDGPELRARVKHYLQQQHIREALFLASPQLFEKIKTWEVDPTQFDDLELSVARYLLRMAFRATPFGTFSCVSEFSFAGDQLALTLPAVAEQRKAIELDAVALIGLVHGLASDGALREQLRFGINDTICRQHDAVTFTAYLRSPSGRRIYQRVEFETSVYLEALIALRGSACTKSEYANFLSDAIPECSVADAQAFIDMLIDEQFLTLDHLVDLTSDDYLSALQTALGDVRDARVEQITKLLAELRQELVDPLPRYKALESYLIDQKIRMQRNMPVKVDLYGDHRQNHLPAELKKRMHDTMQKVLFFTKSRKLTKFISRFQDRFGEAEVPVAQVVEELESLGFVEKETASSFLVRAVSELAAPSPERGSEFNYDLMIKSLTGDAFALCKNRFVDLDELLPKDRQIEGCESIVSWWSVWRDQAGKEVLELKSLGAQEPGRVMGRFAHQLPNVQAQLKNSALQHADLVVEIVHVPEDRLANISARPQLSAYEVRLRTGSGSGAKQITLEDLQLSVRQGRIVIRSQSLNRIVRLRMSNAHAFDGPQNLPVYRFLNDISLPEVHVEALSLRAHNRNAPYLPGLRCHGVILSRPSWKLSSAQIDELKRAKGSARLLCMANLATKLSIPKWVSVAKGDNVIPFCIDCGWMLDELVKMLANDASMVLFEVESELQSTVSSQQGLHQHELLVHHQFLRAPTTLPEIVATQQSTVAPIWGDWAYFNLYGSKAHQNAVLKAIGAALPRILVQTKVTEFFFIRYRDNGGDHLRLRFRHPDGLTLSRVLPALQPVFAKLSQQRLIHAVTTTPYLREVSRYGGERALAICERIFALDSALQIDLLELELDERDEWRVAALLMDRLLIGLGIESLSDRLEFAKRASSAFAAEFKFGPRERTKIGLVLKMTRSIFDATAPESSAIRVGIEPIEQKTDQCSDVIAKAWRELLSGASFGAAKLYEIRWAIVHMRMNRYFKADQRLQEAMVWELLKRSYLGGMARASVAKALEIEPVVEA